MSSSFPFKGMHFLWAARTVGWAPSAVNLQAAHPDVRLGRNLEVMEGEGERGEQQQSSSCTERRS